MPTSRMALVPLLVVLMTAFAVPVAGQGTPDPPPCLVSLFIPPGPPSTFPSIAAALNSAPNSGATISVSGVCTEPELFILDRFTSLNLIGVPGTEATIQGTSAPLGNVLSIRGRSITVRGLRIISGGAKYGMQVFRGGTALIDNNVIEGFAGEAITVNQHAFARIINNTLQNNGGDGILVSENSAVRVGFTSTDDLAPQPNTIRSNGLAGIRVTRTSSARITKNLIAGNGEDGIAIVNSSHADIVWNDLSENLAAGIRIHLNSSARVGIGSGRADWDVPNLTTTNNLGAGLECTLGGAVEGSLGTLSGVQGPHKFGQGCMHKLTP